MSTATLLAPSMNDASDRDPFNNNGCGTTIDRPYKPVTTNRRAVQHHHRST